MYSEVDVLETITSDQDYWINYSFVRKLDDYPDLLQEDQEEDQRPENGEEELDYFAIYFSDPMNVIAVISMVLIVIGTLITVLIAHRIRMRKKYKQFKKKKRKEQVRPEKDSSPEQEKT